MVNETLPALVELKKEGIVKHVDLSLIHIFITSSLSSKAFSMAGCISSLVFTLVTPKLEPPALGLDVYKRQERS